tara:strand:+ start:329 stop:2371 length:2043 start_codon:yes stop_codon:yes gene_type:complete
MATSIEEYFNSINVDEEIKKLQKEDKKTENQLVTTENNDPSNNITMAEAGAVGTVGDVAASAVVGAADTITYIIDLPFMLTDALDKGGKFLFEKAAEAAGFEQNETQEMEQSYADKLLAERQKVRPGKYLRENFLTYDTDTKIGEYARSIGEFAVGGIFGKSAKAANTLAKTGAVSGVVKQGVTDVSNEAIGTGVGVVTNIGLDLYKLRKGNTAVLTKHIIPDNVKETKEVQKYAKDLGMTLKTSEASGKASVIKMDGTIESSIIGNKVVDKFWENRPRELKNFITNWGKSMGFITKNKAMSEMDLFAQMKTAAVKLDDMSKQAWLINGGNQIKNFNFKTPEINNLVKALNNTITENPSASKELIGILKHQIKILEKSKGNGQTLQNVYRTFRDTSNANFEGAKFLDKGIYAKLGGVVKETLKTNKDWVKANDKYSKFMIGFNNNLTKGSKTKIFDDLSNARFSENPENMGKLFKALNDPSLSKTDIINFTKAINKSKVPNLLENTMSVYFQSKFNIASADGMKDGLNAGTIMYNSIMKNEQTKGNFTEMLYQLAKTKDASVKYKDIEKSVMMFGKVLKASGKSGKAGSTTSANLNMKELMEDNPASSAFEFIRLGENINKWFKGRAFTKSSNAIAEAMVSDKGIDALLELAAGWKDQAQLISYARSVILSNAAVDQAMN